MLISPLPKIRFHILIQLLQKKRRTSERSDFSALESARGSVNPATEVVDSKNPVKDVPQVVSTPDPSAHEETERVPQIIKKEPSTSAADQEEEEEVAAEVTPSAVAKEVSEVIIQKEKIVKKKTGGDEEPQDVKPSITEELPGEHLPPDKIN